MIGGKMKVKVEAIKCKDCQDIVWSRHRHDMRYCKCGKCFIDGGRHYTRVGFETTPPDSLEIEVDKEELGKEPGWPY